MCHANRVITSTRQLFSAYARALSAWVTHPKQTSGLGMRNAQLATSQQSTRNLGIDAFSRS